MKLVNIFLSREAWQHLNSLKMPPITGYKLMKYVKTIEAESRIVEEQRTKFILEATGAKEGEMVSIEPNTPQMAQFLKQFNEAMALESDLKPFDMQLDSLLALLGKEQENALSVSDLVQLEPFFATAEKP
jgi:hypothetical protein